MTRKDFELVAEGFRSSRPVQPARWTEGYGFALQGWTAACQAVSFALTDSNPKFNRKRFLIACGVED